MKGWRMKKKKTNSAIGRNEKKKKWSQHANDRHFDPDLLVLQKINENNRFITEWTKDREKKNPLKKKRGRTNYSQKREWKKKKLILITYED